jgi:hypothetical protein
MTSWNKINANQLLPSSFAAGVSAITGAIERSLEAASASLTLPSFPSLPGAGDATKAVITAILDTLQSLLTAGHLHTLVVPITKTIQSAPLPALPPTMSDLQTALDVSLGPADPIAAKAYANLVKTTGGNAGFYNAFATSLMDPADPNRPQYDSQKDAVVMAVLLIGSPNFSEVVSAASLIDQLTASHGGSSAAARTVPVPQNLRARVAGTSATKGIGVRLDWDVPKAVYSSPYFPGISIIINRYAVIRSTDPKAQSARSVLDLFPSQNLSEGLTSGKSKVLSIGHGLGSAYLDTDDTLEPSVPVYYCVAWETHASEPSGTNTLPFDRISNIAKVSVVTPQPPQTGTSPDWIGTKSAIEAFPSVARAAQTLIEQTRTLLEGTGTPSSRLSGALDLATGASKRLAARASDLATDVQQLATALSRPIPSLYVTQMSSGTGGNVYLMSELAKRLNDKTDTSRPPFDNGEYVCGVCFVAGAPRLADLSATLGFFETMFGPASSANPLLGLLNAIDTAVTQAETAVFGTNMQPLPAGTVVDPTTGQAPVPSTPVTSADGTPTGTLSPDNPNAGDTNVTPISELC